MVSDTEYAIPRIDSIPTIFFESHNYEDAFILLGFKPSGFTNKRIYTNGKESIKVSVADNGFHWLFQYPGFFINERTYIAPNEISIQDNLTPVEILAVLSREWKRIFKNVDIPNDLNFGHIYSEHIKSLKLSRPSKPGIFIERDVFRFTINKVKKESIDHKSNEILKFSLRNKILNINIGAKDYPILVLHSENFNNETICVLLEDFMNMVPKRFSKETVYLKMIKNGLFVDNHLINASWDGANIWEFDEYDEFLSNRLLHRQIWFGGSN